MDFFASKNPDKPIDDVFLTGDGALIKGIDGLFKVQLNVSTRVMDTLLNIKFDPKIDLKIYNPVYLMVPIGAAFAPMGFDIADAASAKASNGFDPTALIVAFLILAVIVAGAVTATSYILKNKAQSELDDINAKIASIKDIEDIVNEYNDAQSTYVDAAAMYGYTENLNENVGTLIANLEEVMPSGISVTSFDSASDGVTIEGSTATYEDIAKFAINLKTIECIDQTFVGSITENVDDQSGKVMYDFVVTCVYSQPDVIPYTDDTVEVQ